MFLFMRVTLSAVILVGLMIKGYSTSEYNISTTRLILKSPGKKTVFLFDKFRNLDTFQKATLISDRGAR